MIITSTSNKIIKYLIQLQNKTSFRKKEGVFIVEGIKMFNEIPKERIISVYVSENFYNNNKEIMDESFVIIKDHIFKQITDTVTPQGILAVVRQNKNKIEEVVKKDTNQLFVVLENLQDPGNMGTIIRTGEAAGVSAIIIGKNSVDIYNSKVIRSTMGSIFRVPVIIEEDIINTIDFLKKSGVVIYAAHLNGKNYFEEDNYNCSTAFLIGNEANGLSERVSEKADKLVKIPMFGEVESLNAAVSASILMYEASKKILNIQNI